MKIELEPSERNYLYRLLENYENKLKKSTQNKSSSEYNLNMVRTIKSRLVGKKLEIDLNKNHHPTNYYSIGGE